MVILRKKHTLNLKWYKSQPLKKIKKKEAPKFLESLYDLLEEGFSLNQALHFLVYLYPHYNQVISILISHLEGGKGIEAGLREVGYSISLIAQIFYGQKQGRFKPALKKVISQLYLKQDYHQKLMKALSYPIFVFIFLIGLLLGMRAFLLPHITSFITLEIYEKTWLVKVLLILFSYFPQILIGLFGGGLAFYMLLDFYLLKKDAVTRSRILIKVPMIRKWIRYYCTYKVSQTFGHFLEGGFSLLQTVEFIKTYPIDPFLTQLAQIFHGSLLKGEGLVEVIKRVEIFQPEFALIIQQGELTSQVGIKCLRYADTLWNWLMEDISKKLGFLQPILFILIAVLIMSMYLLMMLPMLTMEGF